MDFIELLKDAKNRLGNILTKMLNEEPFKVSAYSKRITPFDVVQTEKAIEIAELLINIRDKDDSNIADKTTETNKLLKELIKAVSETNNLLTEKEKVEVKPKSPKVSKK